MPVRVCWYLEELLSDSSLSPLSEVSVPWTTLMTSQKRGSLTGARVDFQALEVKNPTCNGRPGSNLWGWEVFLEKEWLLHYSCLGIHGQEEPGWARVSESCVFHPILSLFTPLISLICHSEWIGWGPTGFCPCSYFFLWIPG